MRGLIAKFPEILGVIPMHNIDLMASTLQERFSISSMTTAMTLTLTEEEAVEAIEKSKARKAANKAKKEVERTILAMAAAAETTGIGERELRKRAARGEAAKYVDDEAEEAEVDEAFEPEAAEEGKKKGKKKRKCLSETQLLKAANERVIELEGKLATAEARVAELEQQLAN